MAMALQWYVVHAYSNYEHKVKTSLQERIKRFGLEDKFGEILVPTEEVVEIVVVHHGSRPLETLDG